MIYIIEGPDGSGKTTLANKLAEMTGARIEHRSKPETDEEKIRMTEMYMDVVISKRDIILDRCWYSEMVYGSVMRDKSYINKEQMYKIEQLAATVGAMVIYCTGDVDTLWKRCTSRGEDYITTRETYTQIHQAYEELMACHHLIPVVRYEYNEM